MSQRCKNMVELARLHASLNYKGWTLYIINAQEYSSNITQYNIYKKYWKIKPFL